MERTLAIIKPDAVEKESIGKIINRIESEKFKIVGMKMVKITEDKAEKFYWVHHQKPFFRSLVKFISSGEIVVLVLERENAINHWREVMGDTDPATAKIGTIRKEIGSSIERNAVHGSDSLETAKEEIDFFFNELEVF
ncbi:MAG: nucleoside-diphosphate kinase [Acidobacteriota bacterium]